MPLLGALAPLLMQVLRWLFLAKLASFIGRIFVTLGIGWATYEYVLDPFITAAKTAWGSIPSQAAMWLSAFGADKAASIMISAYLIAMTKNLVLQKR